jgi:superfamily I DNA and/or RNA helicase
MLRSPRYGALWGVNVGPLEAHQGLEYGVVILCVTRSRTGEVLRRDGELGLGVVGMRNKMCVALTRAKFGLAVIGKGDVLVEEDEAWRE